MSRQLFIKPVATICKKIWKIMGEYGIMELSELTANRCGQWMGNSGVALKMTFSMKP